MERILVLDDEPAMLRSIERELRGCPFPCESRTFTNAAEAMAELALDMWALVIVDYRMPQMDGLRFLELATRVSPLSARLLMSGYSDQSMLIGGINRGCIQRFLQKIWDRYAFQEAVAACLQIYRDNLAHYNRERNLFEAQRQAEARRARQEHMLAWKICCAK